MRPLNRPAPLLGPDAMKTYAIVAPAETHFRPATCAEVDCAPYLHGWSTTVDESTDLGQGQAHYIRKQSGRKFTESRDETGTVFTFEPGQRCFKSDAHQTRLERPELFIVRDGDHRGNPRGTSARKHVRPADWVDDFAEHQSTLAERLERG